MNVATEREWHRLQAEWAAARKRLSDHWVTGIERGHDTQWLADLRTYETLVDRAAEDFMTFAASLVFVPGFEVTFRPIESPDM